jgi:hypothetical protein
MEIGLNASRILIATTALRCRARQAGPGGDGRARFARGIRAAGHVRDIRYVSVVEGGDDVLHEQVTVVA